MTPKTRSATLVLVGTVVGVSLTLGQGVMGARTGELPLDQMRTFTDVFSRIKSDYVEEVSDDELLEYAIRGMLNGLDPHSAFLNEEEFAELRVGTTGEFGGLGIEVGMEDGFVKVVAPIDDTPAAEAGMRTGDLIIRLDDTPVKGLSLNDAVKLMRGKPGSVLSLTVIREGEDKPLTVDIERAVIKVTSVRGRTLDDGYGYVRISNFQTKTTADMLKKVRELKDEAGGSLEGLVLDLRNNPGGVLSGAVGVSDAFLDDGNIVYTDGRESDSKLRYDATSGRRPRRRPARGARQRRLGLGLRDRRRRHAGPRPRHRARHPRPSARARSRPSRTSRPAAPSSSPPRATTPPKGGASRRSASSRTS